MTLTDNLIIPRLRWDKVAPDLDRMWTLKESPHHSIIGLTGSGKSYFVRHSLAPMMAHDRVLILDAKGDDPTLKGWGKPVKSLPSPLVVGMTEHKRDREPYALHYRLVIHDDWDAARTQVQAALTRCYKEGRWVIVADETTTLTDPRPPGLRLAPQVELIWRKGRSRNVALIAMTQEPSWVPRSFYSQPSFVWIGRVNDEDKQKRLREIGGLPKSALPVIQGIRKREFLLIADGGDYLAITGAPT